LLILFPEILQFIFFFESKISETTFCTQRLLQSDIQFWVWEVDCLFNWNLVLLNVVSIISNCFTLTISASILSLIWPLSQWSSNGKNVPDSFSVFRSSVLNVKTSYSTETSERNSSAYLKIIYGSENCIMSDSVHNQLMIAKRFNRDRVTMCHINPKRNEKNTIGTTQSNM
jgi:hypothetical protein